MAKITSNQDTQFQVKNLTAAEKTEVFGAPTRDSMRARGVQDQTKTISPADLADKTVGDKLVDVLTTFNGDVIGVSKHGYLFQRSQNGLEARWRRLPGPAPDTAFVAVRMSVSGFIYGVTEEGKLFVRKPDPYVFAGPDVEFVWVEIAGPEFP